MVGNADRSEISLYVSPRNQNTTDELAGELSLEFENTGKDSQMLGGCVPLRLEQQAVAVSHIYFEATRREGHNELCVASVAIIVNFSSLRLCATALARSIWALSIQGVQFGNTEMNKVPFMTLA